MVVRREEGSDACSLALACGTGKKEEQRARLPAEDRRSESKEGEAGKEEQVERTPVHGALLPVQCLPPPLTQQSVPTKASFPGGYQL